MTEAELNALSKTVLDAAYVVHTTLGPGLLESAYKACMVDELRSRNLLVQVEVPVPLVYRGRQLSDVGYRIDLLIDGELVIEVKALEAVAPVHTAQLVSYLRLADKRLGLLLNFNVEQLRSGIYRRVNGL